MLNFTLFKRRKKKSEKLEQQQIESSGMASSSSCAKEFVVGGRYKLIRKIGSGSFGDIYLALNLTNGEVSSCYVILSYHYTRFFTRKMSRKEN